MIWLTSDNAGPAHPKVIDAMAEASSSYSGSYGADPWMETVTDRIRAIFEAPEAEVFLVATGTAANALALGTLCPPWGAVYCHRGAHVEEDEAGAPEFFTHGAKLTLIDGPDARMDPDGLARALEEAAPRGVHNVQRGAVTITQATELGAVHTLDHLAALTGAAARWDVPVHMDGARFANALVRLGCSAAEMTRGVDAVSFGGTKNGCMGVEAVVFLTPGHGWEFQLRRKRGAHLFSKHRLLSAQMAAYLEDDLWLELAAAANAAARHLAEGISALPGVRLLHEVEANLLFLDMPRRLHVAAHEAGARYLFHPGDGSLEGDPEEVLACRMVTNWATRTTEIDALLAALTAG